VTLETLIYDFGKELSLWVREADPLSARIFANDLERLLFNDDIVFGGSRGAGEISSEMKSFASNKLSRFLFPIFGYIG
jgi:hypothetical protein